MREPNSLRRQFTVWPYYGISANEYFFTVRDESLYRIENDLVNVKWVIARDMGKQVQITSIDPELLEYWADNNLWENIRVVRPGLARKFQVLSMVRGEPEQVSSYDADNTANNTAYLDTTSTSLYDVHTNPINDLLIVGRPETTVSTNYRQNLPWGTFWAMNDPVVIEYVFSDVTYRRAIKNRIDETTLF